MEEKNINLVINRLSQNKYDQLKREHKLSDDQLYLVNDLHLDGSNQTIINVADPVNLTDVATKNYVDNNYPAKLQAQYNLQTLTPTLSSISQNTSAYITYLNDFSINTVVISSASYPYYFYMPEQTRSSKARDFMVRLEVLSDYNPMPTIGFFGVNESCDFEADDDSWQSIEIGVNLFNFTETKRA